MGNRRNPARHPQAKRLAGLYRLTLDDLIAFDAEVEEIQRTIDSISEETQKKVVGPRCGESATLS